MSATERLLRLFRADQQIDDLQSRLRAAERLLQEQERQVRELDAQRESLAAQLRQLAASIANHESEMARLDAHIERLRAQMNSARTNREYKAFLTEINTFKADREREESAALELMVKADSLKAEIQTLEAQRAERDRLRQAAMTERDRRRTEIASRLNQLYQERQALAKDVPPEALATYEDRRRRLKHEVMAPVLELDRRAHEYACGSCRMALPVETVNALVRGTAPGAPVTLCVSCGCILYMESETAENFRRTVARKPRAGQASER